MMTVANEKGLPAESATSAAILLQDNLDTKAELRADIVELKDVITGNQWPTDVVVTNAEGKEVIVTLTSKEEAEALLQALEARLHTASDTSQRLQIQLQDAMNKQQQAMQTISNIMKSQHDTAKAIIRNLR